MSEQKLYIKTDGPIPEGCDYITAGKVYEVESTYSEGFYVILGDDGLTTSVLMKDSCKCLHCSLPWHFCDSSGNPVAAPWEGEKAAETSAQPPAWQFLQDGEWHTGMNTNDHRRHTEAAGYPTRDLRPINYRAHAEALADLAGTLIAMADSNPFCTVGFFVEHVFPEARKHVAAFDQDRGSK